jgi:hypothetical protein
MRRLFQMSFVSVFTAFVFSPSLPLPGKEFLTDKEIEMIQDAPEIDLRIKIYLAAAALRLKTAEGRLYGKESVEGDPLEFFTSEDLLDGYYRILRSVMFNLDDAFQKPGSDRAKVRSALKELKKTTEQAAKDLEILKKLAEEKQKEELWNLVNNAIDINSGALEGAETGLSQLPESESEKRKKSKDR